MHYVGMIGDEQAAPVDVAEQAIRVACMDDVPDEGYERQLRPWARGIAGIGGKDFIPRARRWPVRDFSPGVDLHPLTYQPPPPPPPPPPPDDPPPPPPDEKPEELAWTGWAATMAAVMLAAAALTAVVMFDAARPAEAVEPRYQLGE